MKKKLLSLMLVAVILVSCLASSFSAYGKTQPLLLNVKMTCVIDGSEDMAWFTYTPDESGTFSFLSYVTPAAEAYLFIKETDPNTGSKQYVQLAYARNDANYAENEHNNRQFCLTYHLDKGITYYFAAGWYLNSRTDGTMTVMLRSDGYDTDIDHIEAECDTALAEYGDGAWHMDDNSNQYYLYNLYKIQDTLRITVFYNDGTSEKYTGYDTIKGYPVGLYHNQSSEHWYPQDDENYTYNRLTVKLLNFTTEIDVNIKPTVSYPVKCKVVDMLGNGIPHAEVKLLNTLVTYTDEDGIFTIILTTGNHVVNINCKNGINRRIIINAHTPMYLNQTNTPIELVTCDYVNDDVINAKDFAYMARTLPKDILEAQKQLFEKSINPNGYNSLVIE